MASAQTPSESALLGKLQGPLFPEQVERHSPNIKGRPALPAARPFFIHVVRFTISDIVYYPFRNDSGN
jgi:hypothetical protein